MVRTVCNSLIAAVVCALVLCAAAQGASISIDANARFQKWEGWGTSDLFAFDELQIEPEAGAPGVIPSAARKEILRLYYNDLGMNFVRFNVTSCEPENDNNSPSVLNPAGFNWKGRGIRPYTSVDPFCEDHLVLGREFRLRHEPFVFYPVANQWENWMSATPDAKMWWFSKGGRFNPAMVDEYAEHAAAVVIHIKQLYGYELPYWSLFNEPKNTARPGKETTLSLVLACGRRFTQSGLKTKLVICDDVTPEASAEAIEYVLADEEARRYVGAVSYHRYCGDFVLETVRPMLRRIDRGELLVKEPVSFYKSAAKYGKPIWLSEQCSYGDAGITYLDTGRARANHICDEISYGGVNSFNFMLCYFIERGRPGNEETPIFIRFKDGKYAGAEINTFGSWISHFTKYIRPGAVRLGADSGDRLVKAAAFLDDKRQNIVLVVINNRTADASTSIELRGGTFSGRVKRVRTSSEALRRGLPDVDMRNGRLVDTLPGRSITTYVVACD